MVVARFAHEYLTVRRAEGWGSQDGAYYRALPYRDLTGRFDQIWRIRARSYDTFLRQVLQPLECAPKCSTHGRRKLTILDLGAGSGWLAYRLAAREHAVVAIDLLGDKLDGLGAARHYGGLFHPLLGEFDHLPLERGVADLAVFNASFHYSPDYATTLRETLRVLQPGGTLVVLDTPMYTDPTSGARMVQERESRFLRAYGFASNALASEHFLTYERLDALGRTCQVRWRVHYPRLAWRDALGRRVSSLRARREAARFPVVVGCRE